jgi:hypothetical protein
MSEYDYYEEPQPVPTFSDGSSGAGRGANSRAAASRAIASKSAVSAASRASAMMAASIQQLPKNAIITSNGIRNIQQQTRPNVNIAAVKAAQRRSEDMLRTVKPPEPIVVQLPAPPRDVVAKIPETTTILHTVKPDIIVNTVSNSQHFTLTAYKDTVNAALFKKQELLEGIEIGLETPVKKYGPVKYKCHSTIENNDVINQVALEKLSANLLRLLNSPNKSSILNEFNQYQISLRTFIEEPLHKNAVEEALTRKARYLTSDA